MSKNIPNRKELFNRRGRSPQAHHEKTYVQRRSNRVRRTWRKTRILIPIGILVFWIYMMWTNPVVANVSLAVLARMAQIVFVIMFILVQFIAMFWFLGRSRSYDIYRDRTTEGLTYEDYPGQPELLERAKQIVGLLQGVRRFENMGGEPLSGLLLEGPPGTGKTRLAQVMSTEANVPMA